jgi:pimeloyl-ACP methyl ester carboxylesterase
VQHALIMPELAYARSRSSPGKLSREFLRTTMILTGELDPVTDPSTSDDLAKMIPKSTLAPRIKDALHGFPYSHWKETLAALTGFLK